MKDPDIIRHARTSRYFAKIDDNNEVLIDGERYQYQANDNRFVKITALPRLEKEEREYHRRQVQKLIDRMNEANNGCH
jgi:ABC-type Zn uptake system ZnuABC Zn-binding protein ZnuA